MEDKTIPHTGKIACIVGKKKVGKTEYIKRNIIPLLDDYVVFDVNNEYSSEYNRLQPADSFQEELRQLCMDTPPETTIIVEDMNRYYAGSLYPEQLLNILKGKKVIFVFQSIQNIPKVISDSRNLLKVILLPSYDTQELRDKFMVNKHADKVKIIIPCALHRVVKDGVFTEFEFDGNLEGFVAI